MTFDLEKARVICSKIAGREIFNAGCCTVAEMVTAPGRDEPEFCEVAHPEYCDWCEILPFAVNSLSDAVAEIERLQEENKELDESLTAAYLLGSHTREQKMAARIKELDKIIEDMGDDFVCQMKSQDAKIAKLEAALVDSRAEYLHILDANSGCSAWDLDELPDDVRRTYREQAQYLLEMEEPLMMLELEKNAAYIKRLEDIVTEYQAIDNANEDGFSWAFLGKNTPALQERYRSVARKELRKEGTIANIEVWI